MKEEYFIQIVKDIRKLKKKLHKTNTKFKRKIESLENENKTLKSKLKKCETELSYCKKYDLYYLLKYFICIVNISYKSTDK